MRPTLLSIELFGPFPAVDSLQQLLGDPAHPEYGQLTLQEKPRQDVSGPIAALDPSGASKDAPHARHAAAHLDVQQYAILPGVVAH